MEEQRPRPRPATVAGPTPYDAALTMLDPVARAFSGLNLSIKRGDAGQADIKRFWEHVMSTLIAAQPAVLATYGGTPKAAPVEPMGSVTGQRMVRLTRCTSCGGIADLSLGGVDVNMDRCLCEVAV